MDLKYIGKTIDEVGVVPLPEGWPAADHTEPDEGVAAAKLASGSYRNAAPLSQIARVEGENEAEEAPKPANTHRKKAQED